MATSPNKQQTIDQLNSFLRGEMSAVETYRQAMDKVKAPAALPQLKAAFDSHNKRVTQLEGRIVMLGGTPATGSGPWGTFVKLVEGGAAAFGDKAAIDALEQGEDHGIADYKGDVEKLDGETRAWFDKEIFAAQKATHGVMSTLKKTMQ